MELPSRSRLEKARKIADKWHGALVKHKQHGIGRVSFTDVLADKWLCIKWEDGTTTEHMGHILSKLRKVPESEAPAALREVPTPVTVAVTINRPPSKLDQLTQAAMRQGYQDHALDQHLILAMLACSPLRLHLLIEVMGTSLSKLRHECGFQHAVISNHPSAKVGADHRLNPFAPRTYETLSECGSNGAFFILAPHALLDNLLPIAMTGARLPIMVQVPTAWVSNGPPSRFAWLTSLRMCRQVLTIYLYKDGLHHNAMLILFPTKESRLVILPPSLSRNNIASITISA